MRGIEARPYVVSIFSDGRRYYREEIQEKVNQHFGKGTYTEKQIRDLLRNLVTAKKLAGNAKEGYQRVQEQTMSYTEKNSTKECEVRGMQEIVINGSERGESVSIEEFVKNMIAQCDAFKKYCDEPNFLSRVGKNADLNYISRVYNEAKKTRRRFASLNKTL